MMTREQGKGEEEEEISRKRNNSCDSETPSHIPNLETDEENDFLALSLSFRPTRLRRLSPVQLQQPPPLPPLLPPTDILSQFPHPVPQPPLQLSPTHNLYMPPPPLLDSSSASPALAGPVRPARVRRNPIQPPREERTDAIPAPFPWATTQRATVHSLNYLLSKRIVTITGQVQCKRCERQYEMAFDLKQKLYDVGTFIARNKSTMHDRAPPVWMNPELPTCKFCEQENSTKPIISEKKKFINWLFLLLGQMIGCCTLEQLKYFCKHTKNHRTGAKDRVLYLTYLGLCKQLDPNGPFDR